MSALTDAGHPRYRRKYEEWKRLNPEAMALFRRFAAEAARDRKRYSIWTIAARIRWHIEVETRGDTFKVNNSWLAYIARDLVDEGVVPETFFELRCLRSEG